MQKNEPPLRRDKFKVVFDTGVILQGALSDTGPAGRCLRLLDDAAVEAYINPALRSEYETVLTRDSLRMRFSALTQQRIDTALLRFDTEAKMVALPSPSSVQFPRDPKDEPSLNIAFHTQADFIVTRDNDLLDIANFRTTRLVDPVTFLRLYAEQELEKTQ